jgi:hypothetical protein
MGKQDNTAQELGRNDNNEILGGVIPILSRTLTPTGVTLDLEALDREMAFASPLPWLYDDGGRVVSVPLERAWDGIDALQDDDPRWGTLPDPTVAFVTPASNGNGQGDRDARFFVRACNSVPLLLRRIRALEENYTHMVELRKRDVVLIGKLEAQIAAG